MGKERSDPIPAKRRTALVIAPFRGGNDEIVQSLRRERFKVTSVRTVYDGIAEFMREPAKLVVLSLEGLGRRDRKALRIFQRRAPEMRVLLLVPEGRRSDVPAFLSAGADAMLPSPVYGRELQLIVRSMLRGDAADPLTGLPNKEAYERALEREMSRAKRDEKSLALVVLDLDHFGRLNADHGFLVADRVLCETADRLAGSIRSTDVMARWGGDEFVALVTRLPPSLADARKEVHNVLERARSSVQDFMTLDKTRVQVRTSAGVAFFSHEGDTREALFNVANRRLRHVKENGRDRVAYGDEPEG